MIRSIHTISRFASLKFPCVILICASGCGYAEYEARLAESQKYYAYLDRIEQSLAPKWSVPPNLMELRVLRQFTQIPEAPSIKKEDGTIEPPAFDPRQPDYVKMPLPGLFGAWESLFKVAKRNGEAEERKGYIYVLSNYWELAGENAPNVDEKGEFFSLVKSILADKLRVAGSDEPAEVHPKGVPAYQPMVTYDVCSFKGVDLEGVTYTFDVYCKEGPVVGVIIVALPEGMDAPQKVSERIPLMLGSFHITTVPPKSGADKNVPAPATNTPAF